MMMIRGRASDDPPRISLTRGRTRTRAGARLAATGPEQPEPCCRRCPTAAAARAHARELLLDDGTRRGPRLHRLAFETVAQRGHVFPRVAVEEEVIRALGRRGPDPQSVLAAADGHHSFHGHEGNRTALSRVPFQRSGPLQVPPP